MKYYWTTVMLVVNLSANSLMFHLCIKKYKYNQIAVFTLYFMWTDGTGGEDEQVSTLLRNLISKDTLNAQVGSAWRPGRNLQYIAKTKSQHCSSPQGWVFGLQDTLHVLSRTNSRTLCCLPNAMVHPHLHLHDIHHFCTCLVCMGPSREDTRLSSDCLRALCERMILFLGLIIW